MRRCFLLGACTLLVVLCLLFFLQAEDGIRDLVRSRGLGDVYKRQLPGHQAGAPLRQLGLDAVGGLGDLPSPAIRPGLRCGTGKIEANAIELGIPPLSLIHI